jgi:hypothetical protein
MPESVAEPEARADVGGSRSTSLKPLPFSPKEVLQRDPALQRLFLDAQRSEIDARYGPLARRLSLSEGQTERFFALLLRRAERDLDIENAAQGGRLDDGDTAVAELRRSADLDLRGALRELLGDEAYHSWGEFERTVPARQRVDDLAGRLALADLPLSAAQAESLTQVIANGNPRYRHGGVADAAMPDLAGITYEPAGTRLREDYDWPAVLMVAKKILGNGQFALFETIVTADVSLAKAFNQAQDARERGELPALKTVMIPGPR